MDLATRKTKMEKIYRFIFESGDSGRTLTELARKFRNMNSQQMDVVLTKLNGEGKTHEVITYTKGRPITRLVATHIDPEDNQIHSDESCGDVLHNKNAIRRNMLKHLCERIDGSAKTNYCPPCGADISGRKKQVATYTAAVAHPTNRGIGFSVDVWRVCESCAIKIMTGEHKDLIARDSIGAVVIRNADPK